MKRFIVWIKVVQLVSLSATKLNSTANEQNDKNENGLVATYTSRSTKLFIETQNSQAFELLLIGIMLWVLDVELMLNSFDKVW